MSTKMHPDYLQVGDTVAESGVGPGTITGITDAGYPQVNHVAVARLIRTDGITFDPYNKYTKEEKDVYRLVPENQKVIVI